MPESVYFLIKGASAKATHLVLPPLYCVCPASSRRSGRHCGAASLRNNYVPSRLRTMGTWLSCQDASDHVVSDHVVSPYDEHLRILLNFGASEREAREALAKYSGDALIPVAVRNHSSCARAPCYSRFGLWAHSRGVGCTCVPSSAPVDRPTFPVE